LLVNIGIWDRAKQESKGRRSLWIEFYQNPTLKAMTWRATTDEVAAAKRSEKAEKLSK